MRFADRHEFLMEKWSTIALARFACLYAGAIWGIFWIPVRAINEAGIHGPEAFEDSEGRKCFKIGEYIFKNLRPELVEMNEPPIITKIKYKN